MSEHKIKEDRRFKQSKKEMIYTILFFIFNIVLVFALTFLVGYNVPANEVTLIFGFPDWYFYGVLVSFIILVITTYLMVKLLFKDIPIDSYIEEDNNEN